MFALTLPFLARGGELPANLGLGLKQLVETHQRDQAKFRSTLSTSTVIQGDQSDRVTVNIHLNGSKPAGEVASQLQELGLEILAVDPVWRKGVISAHLPMSQAVAAASLSGVKSVLLAPKPIHFAGRVTAESSVVDRANKVNAAGFFNAKGILGKGISVGIVSDSYDAARNTPRAQVGIASGDLPGAGNPDGYTQSVVVIDDNFAPNGGQTDEGRAMAEIVHDIAPAAKLAFSTVQQTQPIMAFSIRNLRANAEASCDIIVDDVFFFDEPFFSDGQLSLAVEDVVNGTSLPGKKVAYFSAAGNSANQGYSADLKYLTVAQGLAANTSAALPQIALDFSDVPAELYAGGFHNVNPSGNPAIAMPITSSDSALLDFQWDDPFDANAVTTDYNLLVFDDQGNYVSGFSGTDDNISTDEPLEFAFLTSGSTYYLVISLATSAPPVAKHLRFIAPSSTLGGPYIAYEAIAIAGHATAKSANATAAYIYNTTPDRDPNYNPARTYPPPGPYKTGIEDFTSNGGALVFYFDAAGNRLATPEVRLKPDLAAADGVNTTFFGGDYEHDSFPNFFGTSAAAPTAAGIAALMLEAAGGPLKLTPAQIRSKMQQTAIPHDLDPFLCTAMATRGSATVQLIAHGNASTDSAYDPKFFTLSFTGNAGQTLNSLSIDLTNAGLLFDPAPATGFPFTYSSDSGTIVATPIISPDRRRLLLQFPSTFRAGDRFFFGIDRDFEGTNAGGNLADLLAGATIKAEIDGVSGTFGAFANQLGNGFSLADGYGLIDARKAVETVLGKRTVAAGAPVNVSTRAFVGTNDNVLIAGFIVGGSAAKSVIIRGLGPSLLASGVPAPLQDPTLQLFDANGNLLVANNNWQDDPTQTGDIQGSGLAPSDPRESAIARTLNPSSYTAILRGANNTVGNALVEVYDRQPQQTATHLVNLASRGLVQTDNNVMIGGFIIQGIPSTNVILRALGPSLAGSGVAGTLPDPVLGLYDSQGNVVAANDNWQQDSGQPTDVQAAGLAPTNAVESALAVELISGNYTAVVRGKDNSTGVALVEMYKIQ